jgi:CheY-like chemotaxis protein
MAKLLGHRLSVRSWPGKGTVFSIALPLTARSSRQEVIVNTSLQQRPLPGLRVICVDDDAANLAALKVLLEQWQISEVQCFYDEQELLAYASTHPAPDVLLLDYQLGQQVNGLELYRQIQTPWGKVPGVLVSASPQADLAALAKEEGLMFLAKPIKPGALRAMLNHFKMLKRAGA